MTGSYGKPYGVNYAPSTPLPSHERERIRSYFANDIVRAVGVGIDVSPIRRAVEPPLDPPSTESGRGPGRIEGHHAPPAAHDAVTISLRNLSSTVISHPRGIV